MTASLIHQMYIAYYQRPADPAGLAYWQAQLTANGGGEAGWNAVAAAFANAAESSALYGSQTLSQKISAIYLAAFERAAVDSEVTYWASSGFTEAQIAFAIVNGAQNDDLTTVQAKETYATNFVAALDPAGTGVGPFSYEYSDPSIGRTLMDEVTKDSDVSTATVAAQVAANVPTLVTVSLTSGADTVTPTTNAVENISAALGGSSPSLGRTDQIDGGSASDTMTITTDSNFLLGFSTGYIKNVETINLTTTTTSVTTKLINLTGVSGVETYNVGASFANVKLSEVSDVGGTINLSGLSTGTFEVGFSSGAISASGSAMTLGMSDVGSTGDAVQLITQGVTDLTLVASGVNNTESFVNLSNTSNTYQTITVNGSSDLYISDVGSAASALLASSFAGDLTFTLDLDTNDQLGASGNTITGGAGNDTLRLMGSAEQFKASTSSIEELYFDGSQAEAVIKATGMVGISTLTFSGQNATNAISLSGLSDTARVINSINDGGTVTQVYSAGGSLTVNLLSDPDTYVANQTVGDNDFILAARNTGAVTINVGSYVSAAGSSLLTNATTLAVSVDATSTLGGNIRADKATTIAVTGGADIEAAVSGAAATTMSFDVGSGTIAVGSTGITTFSLSNSGSVQVTSANRLSGVETITIDTQSDADLSFVATTGLQTLSISGSGTLAGASIGQHSGKATSLTISLTGLEGGFSASAITKLSSDLTVSGTNFDGDMFFETITASGLTVTMGSKQDFHADSIYAENFTLDGAASTSSTTSADISLGAVTGSASITISLGAGTGVAAATNLNSNGAITVDSSGFGGKLNMPTMSGSGITVSMGAAGDFSATTINSAKTFTLDGSNSASSNVTQSIIEASTDATMSLGSGTGSLSVLTRLSAGGTAVIEGSKGGATMDVFSLTASGATISLSTIGDFSASTVLTNDGAFVLDGAAATSAQISIGIITASAAVTISMGAGSGALAVTGIDTVGAITVDGSTYTGTMDLNEISASGISVVTGTRGDFSAQDVVSSKNFVLDASKGVTAQVTLSNLSASGTVTISLGSGTGALSTGGANSAKSFTLDASKNGGSLDLGTTSASGVSISLGTVGNVSAATSLSTNGFTLDGAAAASSDITLGPIDVRSGNLTLSLGAGSGGVSMLSASAAGTVTIDGTNSKATMDIRNISASGTISIVTGTSGDFSAQSIIGTGSSGGFTFDASNASGATISMVTVSVGNVDSAISLGSGAGTFSANVIATDADLTIDMSKSNAAGEVAKISASGLTVTLGAAGNFSANIIAADNTFTMDGTAAVSADVSLTDVSAVDSISLTLAGSATMSAGGLNTVDTFTLSASGANESIELTTVSASGITITTGLQGDVSAGTLNSSKNITIDASGATTAQGITLTGVSASAAISITLGAGSGSMAMSSAASLGSSFTLDATLFDGEIDQRVIKASGITISLGEGSNFSASAIQGMQGSVTFNSQDTDASGETIGIIGGISASGISMNMAAASLVSAEVSSIGAGGGNFNFSGTNFNGSLIADVISASGVTITTGENFEFSASAINAAGSFTLDGAAAVSANITMVDVSASTSVALSFGSMSGDLLISSLNVIHDLTISGENAAGLGMTLHKLSASGITISLGEVGDASNQFSASAIAADNFTLNAGNFKDSIYLNDVSVGSAMTITIGESVDDFAVSSINTELFTFNGGDSTTFSATMTSVDIAGSAWTITMPEMGNGLTINNLSWSANGTIVGTQEIDSISASASQAAGDTATLDVDFRADSVADVLNLEGTAGSTYVILRNFSTGTDKVAIDATAAGMNNIAITAGAAMINSVLGTTLTATDIASAATSLYTYNGDSYFVSDEEGTTGSFGNGDFVIRFVGVTDIVHSDITIDA